MQQLLVAVVLAAVVVVVAVVLQRSRRPDPASSSAWAVPAHLQRDDFPQPTTPWLVVVFSSATCSTCADVWEKARALASDDVAVAEAEVGRDPELHRRYGVEAVPTLVVADADGAVRASHVGPLSAAELWSVVADVREPGSAA